MEDINRLKLLLVEKKKTSKWLSSSWALPLQPYRNGVPTPLNLTWKLLQRFPNYLMLGWKTSITNSLWNLFQNNYYASR